MRDDALYGHESIHCPSPPAGISPAASPDSLTLLGSDAAPRVVVIGIGNNLLGDDGAGIHVVELLRSEEWPAAVEILDGGTLSFSLLEYIEAADLLIVVDAAFLDASPGTVAVFRNAELDAFLATSRRPSVHEINLLDLLGAARLRGRLPREYALVAIEPANIDWNSQPSTEIVDAIAVARDRVAELIGESLQ